MYTQRYIDLLIFQYQVPKAQQTIKTLTQLNCDIVNNILMKFIKAFDIDKAVGRQLDIIGALVGQSRNFNTIFYYEKFTFGETDGTIEENGVGFSLANNLQDGIFTTPAFLQKATYTANDDDYRFMIKLKIFKNHNSNTNEDYYRICKEIFKNQVVFTDNRDMTIEYLLLDTSNNIKNILISNKEFLPAPAGVNIKIIATTPASKIFEFYDINTQTIPDFAVGFSTPNELIDGVFLEAENFIF